MTDETITDAEYIVGFGDDGFGQGTFGGSQSPNNITELRAFIERETPLDVRPHDPDDDLDPLLQSLADQLYQLDIYTEELRDNRFVDTATGDQLDLLATSVGTQRKTSESDDTFRTRVEATYAKNTSDCTYETFGTVAKNIFNADGDEIDLEFDFPNKPGTVIVVVELMILEDSPLSENELKDLLDDAVPAGHRVELQTTGTFQFDDGTSSGKGFNQGTWEGTVSA